MSLNPPPNMADPNIVGNAEGNHRQAERDRTAIRARLDEWPPHPSIECGYTAPDGRRWIHVPWAGWQATGPHFLPRRRRRSRWWSR